MLTNLPTTPYHASQVINITGKARSLMPAPRIDRNSFGIKVHRMTTTKQFAQWMIDRLEESDDGLLQVDAVAAIEAEFGDEFTYISDIGEKSIDRNVLAQFRKLTGDDVVWVTLHGGGFWAGAHWRKRGVGDSPGRTQYEYD